jgi:single-strand DNA-binding protein
MNKWIGMGRLTRDPETRNTQDGMCISRYTIAVDRRGRKDSDGADFIPVKAFGKAAEFADRYLHKGMKIVVSGRIQTDSYTNREGEKVSAWEIVADEQEFAESKGASASAQPEKQNDDFMRIPDGADDAGLPFN